MLSKKLAKRSIFLSVFLVTVPGVVGRPHRTFAAVGDSQERENRVVQGRIVQSASRWTQDQRQIVTDSVLQDGEGKAYSIFQVGGQADGLRLTRFPAPPILETGDRATLRLSRYATPAGEEYWTVREVLSLSAAGQDEGKTGSGSGPTLRYARSISKKQGAPVYWASNCVHVVYDAAGTSFIPGDKEFAVMDEVLQTWNRGVSGCAFIRLIPQGRRSLEVAWDGINLIKFRDDRWCHSDGKGKEECNEDEGIGLTTTVTVDDKNDPDNPQNGRIVDADIEINTANYSFSLPGRSASQEVECPYDLASTVTHEVGHLLGLAHTCLSENDDDRIRDQWGQPLSPCWATNRLSQEALDATMYGFVDCGESQKRSLSPDDVQGVCAIYPKAMDPNVCVNSKKYFVRTFEQGRVGCGSGLPSGTTPLSSVLIGAAVLVARLLGRRNRTRLPAVSLRFIHPPRQRRVKSRSEAEGRDHFPF